MTAAILTPEQRRLAQALYADRQARATHPDGRFDTAGRWYPSEPERQPCCEHIRGPSRGWPYSLMLHCRTLRHCRALVQAGWRPPPSPTAPTGTRALPPFLRIVDRSGAFPTPPDTPLEEWLAGVDTLLAAVEAAAREEGTPCATC